MNTTRTGVAVNSNLSYVYDNIYQLTQATRPLASQSDETFNFDPLGNRLRRDGETTDSTIGVANHLIDDKNFIYTYTGRELDSESGLYYYRARYYGPSLDALSMKTLSVLPVAVPTSMVMSKIIPLTL